MTFTLFSVSSTCNFEIIKVEHLRTVQQDNVLCVFYFVLYCIVCMYVFVCLFMFCGARDHIWDLALARQMLKALSSVPSLHICFNTAPFLLGPMTMHSFFEECLGH